MASVNFYEFKYAGLVLRSERSLDKLIKWIGHNHCLLEPGIYVIEYSGMMLTNVLKNAEGSICFDTIY